MDNSNARKQRTASVNAVFNEFRMRSETLHKSAPGGETKPETDLRAEPVLAVSAMNDSKEPKAGAINPIGNQISAPMRAPTATFDTDLGSPLARQRRDKSDLDAARVEAKRVAAVGSVKHWFDELKINFLARHNDNVKSVLFLGISRGAGASTAALNFARSLAQDIDARVLLINADFRDPSASIDTAAYGLINFVESPNVAPAPVLQGHLHVVPCGRGYADPAVLFQSKRFRAFLGQCKQQYDYVVIDGPPLDEAPESIALCSNMDGVMLVLDAGHTHRRIALRAKSRIEQAGGTILGVVLNRRRFYIPNWLYKLIY
jgi:capsular exopolysaccharide synthesis family protein